MQAKLKMNLDAVPTLVRALQHWQRTQQAITTAKHADPREIRHAQNEVTFCKHILDMNLEFDDGRPPEQADPEEG